MSHSTASYYHLCKGSAALGQRGASPSPWPTSSPGEECTGNLVGSGATHHFCRGRCLCDHGAVQINGNNLTTVKGGHATRIPKEPHPNSKAHLRGSMSISHSEGQLATTAKQVTATVGVPTTPPQEFMPHQPASDSMSLCLLPGFVDIAQTLGWEEPMESTPLSVITGIPSEEAIDTYKIMGVAITATRLL